MTHRNRKLLDICHDAPCMLRLGVPGCGANSSVPCHSDMLRHGRGAGHKSHDAYAVPGCPACHAMFTRKALGREGYEQTWQRAYEEWTLYLWEHDKLKVA